MIQRIQSVYLALVAICISALFFTSVATIHVSDKVFIFSIFSLNERGALNLEMGMYPTFLIGLSATVVVLSIYCITLYKTRINQLIFVRFNTILLLILLTLLVVAFDKSFDVIANFLGDVNRDVMATKYLFGVVTPFIALVLNILAYRGIKKDEELVRSADRIR